MYEIGFAKPVTFVLNKSINSGTFRYSANFISNGQSFSSIGVVEHENKWGPYYTLNYDNTSVCVLTSSWAADAYRTVTFEEMPTGALLTWLQANAVQQ